MAIPVSFATVPHILIRPGQILSMAHNLLFNAREALDASGRIDMGADRPGERLALWHPLLAQDEPYLVRGSLFALV